jgi:hypothetical protein
MIELMSVPLIRSRYQWVTQRVYQLVGGYEDANDSNVLRHDPIFKIACGRSPKVGTDLLASQPTITRLENYVGKAEVSAMRIRMVDGFINSYQSAPKEMVLDIDGLGAYRRMKARLGGQKAITATAHKIARIFYHIWSNGDSYLDPGVETYEQKYRERMLDQLQRKVHLLGFDIVSKSDVAECVS